MSIGTWYMVCPVSMSTTRSLCLVVDVLTMILLKELEARTLSLSEKSSSLVLLLASHLSPVLV